MTLWNAKTLEILKGIRAFQAIVGIGVWGVSSAGGDVHSSSVMLREVQVVITERAYDSHQRAGSGHTRVGRWCQIDDHEALGNACEWPKTKVVKIVARIGSRTYELKADGMYNAWGEHRDEDESSVNRRFGGVCHDKLNCVFRGVFGDGAGTFAVQWEVSGGNVRRTVFSRGSDIVSLFVDRIDPPGNVFD